MKTKLHKQILLSGILGPVVSAAVRDREVTPDSSAA